MIGDLVSTGVSCIFPAGRAVKLVKDGVNITNSANPLILAKNITLTVLDCCAPPPIRLAAHCIAAGVLTLSTLTSPNPVTAGGAIHAITEIYNKC